MKVYINPGHDPKYDSGAVNSHSGLRECDVALRVGQLVKHYLEAAGCVCKLSQSDNLYYDSPYSDRQIPVVADANNWGADIFVSIHCNAAEDQRAQGTEVLCYSTDSKAGELARCIQDQIVGALKTTDRGIKERPGLIVLKHTSMPAVLVELGFISNDAEAALLASHQDDFARAIARGITDYQLL